VAVPIKSLGELLLKEKLIDTTQLEKAKREQRNFGNRLGTTVLKLGFVTEKQLVDFLAGIYEFSIIDLNNFEPDPEAIKILNKEICEKHSVFPISKVGNQLVVAFSDPSSLAAKDDLTFISRSKISIVLALESSISTAIEKHFGGSNRIGSIMNEMASEEVTSAEGKNGAVEVVDQDANTDEAPIIRFVNATLTEAIKLRASDIHIEPYEKRFRIRFRVDGNLRETLQPPPGVAQAVISRIKIMSKMNIAEKRKPQDGRLKVKLKSSREIDFRVSSLPTLFGEKIVMRILDKSNLQVDLTKLGFESDDLARFKDIINQPQGLVLITGPTGSGKTTTIYSALAELNTVDINISTAEDPVEFNLDGINQVQVNPDIDFQFKHALKSFLRQDPDVIMVGEIRDLETAEIAYKAASTGHMVVSTLHTNDAPSTVSRLMDMGIPSYMVTTATSLIVAQRLLRKICDNCAAPFTVPDEVLIGLGVKPEELGEFKGLKRGEGCHICSETGMKGRVAIYELMTMTPGVKEAVFANASPLELKKIAIEKDGLRSLRQAAILKLKQGKTTVEEVINTSVRDDAT
jgi:type IV pilus assembly protein PilB